MGYFNVDPIYSNIYIYIDIYIFFFLILFDPINVLIILNT